MSEWTDAQAKEAAEDGWALTMIVNQGDPVSRWYYAITRHPFAPDDEAARQHVVKRATERSELHIQALRLVYQRRVQLQTRRR